MSYLPEAPDLTQHHFFGTSHVEWRCTSEDRDLRGLIKFFEQAGYPYALYLVPGPDDRPYQIKHTIPDVDGVVCLGTFEPDRKKK